MRRPLLILALTVACAGPVAGDSTRPTAVVELFTSEGCSSCPRADVLLGEIAEKAWPDGDVFGLAFHVDYWDRLGWKDRFSDNAFTKRQYRYAERLPDSRVYTPQMVVDGRVGFVGSNRLQATRSIESALSSADEVVVKASVTRRSGRRIEVAYEVTPRRPGLDLNVALVQRAVTTDVRHGENGGRTLHHKNVVRAYKQFPLDADGSGETRVSVPDDTDIEACDVVVYVQDRERLEILGATQTDMKGD